MNQMYSYENNCGNNWKSFFFFQSVIGEAVEEYKNVTKKKTEITVDEQNFLSQDW